MNKKTQTAGGLLYNWQVVAKNLTGFTEGPVWSFALHAELTPTPTLSPTPMVTDTPTPAPGTQYDVWPTIAAGGAGDGSVDVRDLLEMLKQGRGTEEEILDFARYWRSSNLR